MGNFLALLFINTLILLAPWDSKAQVAPYSVNWPNIKPLIQPQPLGPPPRPLNCFKLQYDQLALQQKASKPTKTLPENVVRKNADKNIMVANRYPVHEYEFNNGHRVVFIQRPGSKIVHVQTMSNTGSIDENPLMNSLLYAPHTGNPDGIEHLIEHVILTSKGEKNIALMDEVKQCGGMCNGYTAAETVAYEMTMNQEDFPELIDSHAKMFSHPSYTAKDIEHEKSIVLNERGERVKPGHEIREKLSWCEPRDLIQHL